MRRPGRRTAARTVRARFALAFTAASLLVGGLPLAGAHLAVHLSLATLRAGSATIMVGSYGRMWLKETPATRPALYEGIVQRYVLTAILDDLRLWGGLLLLGGSAVAGGVGWWAAGWALRPLGALTAAAHRVARGHDLHERIRYPGPEEEVKQLADIIDGLLARLARTVDGQRRFIASASHELRTPVAVNRTLVEVAMAEPGAPPQLRRLGESLLVVNARHHRLIDGLLALAQGGQAILARSRFDLADLVEHVADEVAAEAAELGITVHDTAGHAPTVGDPVLVERLVRNLVENAIRHNVPGGRAWVACDRPAPAAGGQEEGAQDHRRPRQEGQDERGDRAVPRRGAGGDDGEEGEGDEGGDMVRLTVENTGEPVPAWEMETIFEPFRRLEGDRAASGAGSGLGLSIVRAIAEAHGGTVTARPRRDGGLSVTVLLPAED
ncbi:hypothetical protein Sru01_39190 [Sphaerisporangium rufum]|uniref:histidine kinase n=1 Tax=Sphaerisporangium rufum TaxID=1381558 RepID=A0A919R817_9ACTN|nr:HAMP domain-containing sensor histidine kinase [Sphaerisporangium rufum]GII78937.1 hypothetical protein Sru01_39190 [Sphaerisporangium rufum]